jgi:hypothetical protein
VFQILKPGVWGGREAWEVTFGSKRYFRPDASKGLLVQESDFWFRRPCTKIRVLGVILVQVAILNQNSSTKGGGRKRVKPPPKERRAVYRTLRPDAWVRVDAKKTGSIPSS